MGTATRSKVLQDLFGERAAGGVVALINGGIASVKQLEAELQNSAGTAKTMGDQLNQSLTFRIMALQNAMQEKGFQVFEGFLTDGKGGLEEMIKAINDFDVKPIVEGLRAVGSGIKWLIDHRSDILRVGIALGTIKGALMLRGGIQSLGALPGMISGMSLGSMGLPLMQMMRGGGAPMPQLPMFTGGGGAAPAPVMPTYRGRHDNWGMPTAVNSVGKFSIASAANVVFAAGTAAVVGYQIGDWIRSTFIDPAIAESFKMREELDTSLLNLAHQIKTGNIGSADAEKQIKQQEEMLGKSTNFASMFFGNMVSFFTGEESPQEAFFRQYKELQKSKGSLTPLKLKEEAAANEANRQTSMYGYEPWDMNISTKAMDEYKGKLQNALSQLEAAREKENNKFQRGWMGGANALEKHENTIRDIDSLYERYLKNLEDVNKATLDSARNGGTANIHIEVSGDGAAKVTTTTKTSGPRAPKVDVNRAGAN